MNAEQVLQYLNAQVQAIQALIDQLDEVQVAFNAMYDEFKALHDALLDRLSDEISEKIESISPDLKTSITTRLSIEQERIDERRRRIREEYLPQRRQAADDLLTEAQGQLAALRALNPQLDEREEGLKTLKAHLEARLVELNEEIRQKSRRLGVVWHFPAITKADRERHKIVGRLEGINESLYRTRQEWEEHQQKAEVEQAEYQERWQLESIAVARLQSELDQLHDPARREDLAMRRAVRQVLDELESFTPGSDPELNASIEEMVQLNNETDDYHEGLASVGGLIGLAGGLSNGLEAIIQSIEGLRSEQRMHSAHLGPLSLSLPPRVEAFHKQWPALTQQFADEKTMGAQPANFAAAVQPLLEGPLSEASIEAMFDDLGSMIRQATASW